MRRRRKKKEEGRRRDRDLKEERRKKLVRLFSSFHSSLLGTVPAVGAIVPNLGQAVKTFTAASALEAAAVPMRAHGTLDLLRHKHRLLAAGTLVARAEVGGLLAQLGTLEAPLLLLTRDRVDGEARGVVAMGDGRAGGRVEAALTQILALGLAERDPREAL